ncbi:MAG: 50S ribosomal protein L30e [Euryarchaeota archaeon]|nr:50S ribosomal protein L30e [Euryarchaeota archaeon]
MDLERAIRQAVDTGRVLLGTKQSLQAVRNGEARLVIVAANCPPEAKEDLMRYSKLAGVPVYEYGGSGMELGAVCGKPYVVSMLAVIEAGDSDILELGRGSK